MSFAAYLTNTTPGHKKHYFVAAARHPVGGAWTVFTAWGRIPYIGDSKEYTGGKTGAFTGEANADAYALSIVKSKVGDGYDVRWTAAYSTHTWPDLDNGVQYDGEEPSWWTDALDACGISARIPYGAKSKAKAGALVPMKPGDRWARLKAKPKTSELKRRLRDDDDTPEKPKVKSREDRLTKLEVKLAEVTKATPKKKEEKYVARKPRFGFR